MKLSFGNIFYVLDNISLGVCVVKKDFTVVFWNKRIEEWTGVKREDMEGLNLAEKYPRLKEKRYVERIIQVCEQEATVILSYQLHKYFIPCFLPDGSLRLQQTTLSPVKLPNSDEVMVMISIEDVTDHVKRIEMYRKVHHQALKEIEERTRAEEKLFQKTSELQAIFLAFPDLYYRLDENGRILDYNIGQVGDNYIIHDVLVGKNVEDVFPPEIGRKYKQAIEYVLENNSQTGFEYSLSLKRGVHYYEARFVPLPHNQIMAIIRDITNKKESEEALRRVERRYEILVESAVDAIFTVDRDSKIISINNAGLNTLGTSRENALGKKIKDLFPIEVAGKLNESLKSVFITGEPGYMIRFSMSTPSGRRWYNLIFSPVKGKDGNVEFVLGIARNITENVKAYEALLESEERLKVLVENAWDCIFLIKPNGKIVDVNKTALQNLNVSKENILRKNFFDLLKQDEKEKFIDIIEKANPFQDFILNVNLKKSEDDILHSELKFGIIKNGSEKFILIIARKRD